MTKIASEAEPGEKITLSDAFHFMMPASSNVTPSVIARYVGEKLLLQQQANAGIEG